jgi:CheY-like chemotaxis protein
MSRRLLWVDDEIDLLVPHIRYLTERGYTVATATNGDDAVAMVQQSDYDLVLLDQMMSGRDGLSTLSAVKQAVPRVPVVMITKSEDESLLDRALAREAEGYLVKPVSPLQILSACRRILESENIQMGRAAQDYAAHHRRLTELRAKVGDWRTWAQIWEALAEWDLRLDALPDAGLEQTHTDLKKESNLEFARFIEERYPLWMRDIDPPPLSVDLVRRYVVPHLQRGVPTFLVVVDGMRLDQWLAIEPLLREGFDLQRELYYSILPTATPYARNAIFGGMFPAEIAARYPQYWDAGGVDDEGSRNRYERQLLEKQLERLGVRGRRLRYHKLFSADESQAAAEAAASAKDASLVALVFNFVDMLTHGRSQSEILREIAPDERAFRALTRNWFERSPLRQFLGRLARRRAVVVLTADHGSVLGKRASLVYGDRQTSTSLRYKYGRNLGCQPKEAVHIAKPHLYKLPAGDGCLDYVLAKEDFYFVYPTRYREFKKQYAGGFQHGGISLEEMIVPVYTATGRSTR